MFRTLTILTLASACFVACSPSNSAQSAAGQSAAPGSQVPAANPDATSPQADGSAKPGAPEAAAAQAAVPAPAAAAPAAAAPAAAASAQAKPAAPVATFREVTIPAGTSLSVTVLSSLASDKSKVEDPVKGSLAKPVLVSGMTALPEGTQITGAVTDAKESGRVKGRASLAFRFNHMVVDGESVAVQTAAVTREAAADTKSDVKKGGLGAGLGAVVGGVVGGGKGAAIGAVAGGTGTVLATKGNEVSVPAGTVVDVLLQDPVKVTVRIAPQ